MELTSVSAPLRAVETSPRGIEPAPAAQPAPSSTAARQAIQGAAQLGIVHWYHRDKGFGFIADEQNPGHDYVFVRRQDVDFSNLEREHLLQGDRVAFTVVDHEKGPMATNVVVTDPAPAN